MGYVYPEEVIQEIKSVNDIYETISEYLPLNKTGQNFRGLCPFHSEKTPSFFVHPEKQIFHCFGCGKGGNVFTFLMQYENISFPEAVRILARRKGIRLPTLSPADERQKGDREKIMAANVAALKFFQGKLHSGPEGKRALSYLEGRGITKEGIKKFQLGWSPKEWEVLRGYLKSKGYNDEALAKAGLIIQGKKAGSYYDRFRNRLIFPIQNERGEVVAFGGRVIDDQEEPKYMNSPETPVYHKGRLLYGMNLAKGPIKDAGFAAVVEGYTDLITAHLAGVTNVVATLGTALTRDHLRLLRRYTRKVTVIYDADKAGIEAARRSLELFLEEDVHGCRAALPEGQDPDSYIRDKGSDRLMEILKDSQGLMDFFIDHTFEKWQGEGIEGKARAVAEITPLLAKMENRVKQSEYIRRIAQKIDIREEAITIELKKYISGRKEPSRMGTGKKEKAAAGMRPVEEELVRAMLIDAGQAQKIKEEIPLTDFKNGSCRAVAAAVYNLIETGVVDDPGRNMSLADEEAASLAARLMAQEDRSKDLEMVVDDCLKNIRQTKLSLELKEIQEKIRKAEASKRTEDVNELLKIKHKIRQSMMA